MIGYLLLGKPIAGSTNPDYRGTYRPGPTYVNELPEEAPINRLWLHETDLMISDPFTDADDAKRIQAVYAAAGIGLDLVMVIANNEIPPSDISMRFLGHDISHASGYSLLSWDLNFSNPAAEFFHQQENPVYQPLLLLVEKHFRPLLNSYRLFQTNEDAEFFLEVAEALKKGFGAVWEAVEYGSFSIVKLYMIRAREDVLACDVADSLG